MSFKNRYYLTKEQRQEADNRRYKAGLSHGVKQPPGTGPVLVSNTGPVFELSLICFKCHQPVRESLVTEHLKICQPEGAMCGKCGEIISVNNFLEHFKLCHGKGVK